MRSRHVGCVLGEGFGFVIMLKPRSAPLKSEYNAKLRPCILFVKTTFTLSVVRNFPSHRERSSYKPGFYASGPAVLEVPRLVYMYQCCRQWILSQHANVRSKLGFNPETVAVQKWW